MDNFLKLYGLEALRGTLKQECFDLETLLRISPEVAAELIPKPIGLRVKLLHAIEKHNSLSNTSCGSTNNKVGNNNGSSVESSKKPANSNSCSSSVASGNSGTKSPTKSKNLGDLIWKAAFEAKKALGQGWEHEDYLEEFCNQLEDLGVDFEEEKEFWWGTPDVYVHCYGPVEIVCTAGGIDELDRDQSQVYANGSSQKCTLISFGTRNKNPVFEYFTPIKLQF